MASKQETKEKYKLYFPIAKKVDKWWENYNFVLVTSMEELENTFNGYSSDSYYMSFDTETTGLNFEELDLVGY
jgi:hypothetical protein